jgi:ribosomal biogenesis protein LAS1
MSKYTITPWRTQTDLLEVRKQLYSTNEVDSNSRRKAVDRIMAWKLRGNLPHAVESTALLVEAILHHDIKTNSIFSIRAVYSAAFSRFVTGFCDIGRHKERSLEPSSMLDIAKQIGMPVEFVALRHEATHEELPGIRRLVGATREALDWLWKVYWSPLEEPEDEEAVQVALVLMRSEAASILREFRRARRDALRSKSRPASGEPGDVTTAGIACAELCKGRRLRMEALAAVIVEERLILPSNRE